MHRLLLRPCLIPFFIVNRPIFVNMARNSVGSTSRAKDVVHDVFIKRADLHCNDAVRQPVAYVMRMMRNAATDACHPLVQLPARSRTAFEMVRLCSMFRRHWCISW